MTPTYKVVYKLEKLKHVLKKLNNDGYSDIECRDVKAYKKMLISQQQLHNDPTNLGLRENELEVIDEYRRIHKDYFSFLHQKAKVQWCVGWR